jgi:hypothetical protein
LPSNVLISWNGPAPVAAFAIVMALAPWQKTAAMKRDKIFHRIPEEWVLPRKIVEKAKDRRKLTGSFIEELLDSRTRDITSLDSVELVDAVSNGSLTAVQVTSAFCKRAAFAHQLVSSLLEADLDSEFTTTRTVICWRSCSGQLLSAPKSSISISRRPISQLDPCMDYRSA